MLRDLKKDNQLKGRIIIANLRERKIVPEGGSRMEQLECDGLIILLINCAIRSPPGHISEIETIPQRTTLTQIKLGISTPRVRSKQKGRRKRDSRGIEGIEGGDSFSLALFLALHPSLSFVCVHENY